MFKPVRLLQVAIAAAFLSSCASSQTTESPSNADSASDATTSAPPSTTSSAPAVPRSTAAINRPGEGFFDGAGKLQPDVQSYAEEVAISRRVPIGHVQHLLTTARYNATVARLMAPGTTKVRRSWSTYRGRFVEPIRIKAGVEFWQEHRTQLQAVEKQYGVPASIIVAIIGVETLYGRHTGDFSVLDALATLAFRYPDTSRADRIQLFRDQLADFIRLDYDKELDARQARGSYAGAMGLPQFMPGSLVRFAVDGDRDYQIDLHNSPADAIASVANFLRQHGWQPGLPVFAPVTLPANAKSLVKGGLEPTYTWAELQSLGAQSASTDAPWQKARLGVIDLVEESRNTAEYRVGTPNFFAITHYNRSYFYATSVAELADAIVRRMPGTS